MAERLGQIVAPLLSPNEPEAQVVEVAASSFAQVARGETVCVLETTKATADVESEWDGWTGPLAVGLGDRVLAGAVICEVFAEQPDPSEVGAGAEDDPFQGRRLSRSAEQLVLESGVDVSLLPVGRFVTEADVRALLGPAGTEPVSLDPELLARVTERSLVVFGAGGHAKSLVDLVCTSTDFEPLCVADDDPGAAAEVLG
ncbi:MAG: biotin/lipoyl-containing protein, partial [Gaiellaceae bacterium]